MCASTPPFVIYLVDAGCQQSFVGYLKNADAPAV